MTIDWTSGFRQAQRSALQFCSSFTKFAIGLFESSANGGVTVVLPLAHFEPFCEKLQSLPEGGLLCRADHIDRARRVLTSGSPELTVCHAGVFNQAVPITVDGRVRAVLMYGQMRVEGDSRCAEAEDRFEDLIREMRLTEDDELELRLHYDDIKRFTRDDLSTLNQQLSSLQQWFYGMLAEEQRRVKHAESILHDVQTRLQPIIALAAELYYGLRQENSEWRPSAEQVLALANGVLQSSLAMRTTVWNLGEFMPEYQFRPCSVKDVVDNAIALYRAEAQAKEVDIRTRLQEPCNIHMSREHLQQAINNLVQNAIKYSFYGDYDRDRFVEIRGAIERPDYVLTFSNYGVGILPEEYERIFEQGYKGELTRGEYRSGSGMGLSIVKEVIEKHHGRIQVNSAPAGGQAYLNKFFVRLPLRQVKQDGGEE